MTPDSLPPPYQPPFTYQPQDLDPNHLSESMEVSDGAPSLEGITSDSGYEGNAEN